MDAAWYEKQGPARDVLVVGQMRDPEPGPGEVRIRVAASGINPGEVKKRQNAFGVGMPHPRVIPHSDGAGTIDRAGEGVSASRIGERVWCYGAQSYRPFGTAAEYVVPKPTAGQADQEVVEQLRRLLSQEARAEGFRAVAIVTAEGLDGSCNGGNTAVLQVAVDHVRAAPIIWQVPFRRVGERYEFGTRDGGGIVKEGKHFIFAE